MTCDGCGITYASLRTGWTFRDARRAMFVHDPDPTTWRHKHRRAVLGFWHEIKLQLWAYHTGQCSEVPF